MLETPETPCCNSTVTAVINILASVTRDKLEAQCSKWGTNGPRGALRVEFSGREKVYAL